MWTVPPAVHSSFNSDFAREITRRFEHGRFLIIGGNADKLKSQFTAAEREAEAWTYDDLASKVSRGGDKAAFETAIWLYPSAQHDDGTVADALSPFGAEFNETPLKAEQIVARARHAKSGGSR